MAVYHLKSDSFTVSGGEAVADWDSEGKHTILLAHAEWCGYCKQTVPDFEKAAVVVSSVNFALLEVVELQVMAKPRAVRG